MVAKVKGNTNRKSDKKSNNKIFFIIIGLLSLILIIGGIIIFKKFTIKPIRLCELALIAGLFYENKRLTGDWKTVLKMTLFSFAFSILIFLPGEHESVYNFDKHLENWSYAFTFLFIIISIAFNEDKIIPKLTEGVTLIQSLALIYWAIDFGLAYSSYLIVKILMAIALIFSLYSILNIFANIALSNTNRLILSIWSSIIMLLFAIDNIYGIYQNDQIETVQTFLQGLFIGLQYFLLGVCSIYIVQNFLMIVGFFPGKGTFFNKKYFRNIKKLEDEHISRYSDNQVNKLDGLICLLFTGITFGLNYYFKLLPRNIAIWIVFIVSPYIIFICNYLRKQYINSNQF
ncbi:MAG: hypothetical protein HXX16_17945 [Bacteroidales bacterium]|nr:hypothetical protein [Bacteroidales bacterium]